MTGQIGIDEAGRGALIGPMVVAGAFLPDEAAAWAAGVRDSKAFGSGVRAKRRRARVAEWVRARAVWAVRVASARMIDSRRRAGHSLDEIERVMARGIVAEIRQRAGAAPVVMDGTRIFAPLCRDIDDARCVRAADSTHACAAAASVLAKVERDRLVDALFARHAPGMSTAGGGYPGPRTTEFLSAYRARHGRDFPAVRETWGKSLVELDAGATKSALIS